MASNDVDRLVKSPEAAMILSVCERMLLILRKEQGLPCVRLGKKAIRYRVRDLHSFSQKKNDHGQHSH